MSTSLPAKLQRSQEVRVQEVAGEVVLLDLASEKFFTLNEVGTRIWQLVVEHGEPEVVFDKMLEEFAVEPQTLRADMEQLLTELLEAGLLAPDADESLPATP